MTTVEQDSVIPEFAHAVRGYDRYQVDDYIERLNEWATEAHTRAVAAEQRAQAEADKVSELLERVSELEADPERPEANFKAAAERSTAAVAAAVEQADAIRHRAAEDAERRLEEAGRQALEIVESARRAVAALHAEVADERQRARLAVSGMMEAAKAEETELRQRAKDQAASIVDEGRKEGERLAAERDEILKELGHLRSAIHSLITADRREDPPDGG